MKKLIIANWKLNPTTVKDAKKLASSIQKSRKNTVVLCPPTIYVTSVQYPNIGAQDCFWEEKGPFTGQTSPVQLKSLKIKYCIVGHSEKRQYGETDGQINFKLRTLEQHGIAPILCVGYGTTAEEDDLAVVDVLKNQLDQDLQGLDTSKVAVAYEPVWAIGTGKTPTPEHAEHISLYIKSRYKVAKVLYGGSVTVFNAKEFLHQPNIDGLLIGGDSLMPKHFNQIINF